MTPTFPGGARGLLQRCSPVILRMNTPVLPDDDPQDEIVAKGVLYQETTGPGDPDASWLGYYDHERIGRGNYFAASLLLDVSDKTGRAHLASWIRTRADGRCEQEVVRLAQALEDMSPDEIEALLQLGRTLLLTHDLVGG